MSPPMREIVEPGPQNADTHPMFSFENRLPLAKFINALDDVDYDKIKTWYHRKYPVAATHSFETILRVCCFLFMTPGLSRNGRLRVGGKELYGHKDGWTVAYLDADFKHVPGVQRWYSPSRPTQVSDTRPSGWLWNSDDLSPMLSSQRQCYRLLDSFYAVVGIRPRTIYEQHPRSQDGQRGMDVAARLNGIHHPRQGPQLRQGPPPPQSHSAHSEMQEGPQQPYGSMAGVPGREPMGPNNYPMHNQPRSPTRPEAFGPMPFPAESGRRHMAHETRGGRAGGPHATSSRPAFDMADMYEGLEEEPARGGRPPPSHAMYNRRPPHNMTGMYGDYDEEAAWGGRPHPSHAMNRRRPGPDMSDLYDDFDGGYAPGRGMHQRPGPWR